MAFIETIPPQDAEGDTLDMYRRQQDAWGYVPNYAKLFSYRPEVMVRWAKLLAEIRRPLDDRRFELATLAAATELKNSSCALAHGQQLSRFLPESEVRAIGEGQAAESLSEVEQEIVRFSRKVARDASSVTRQDVEQLKQAGLSDADIFDIAVTVAGRSFLTKILDALGSAPDSAFSSLHEDLLALAEIGRPLESDPVETL